MNTLHKVSREKVIAHLEMIVENHPHTISAQIAEEALSYYNPRCFFYNFSYTGSLKGLFGQVITNVDACTFFMDHHDEIKSIMDAHCDLKDPNEKVVSFITWFCIEETARKLSSELETL